MAQRRSNQPRKLPAKTTAPKVEDIVTEGPTENAHDVPAGTDLNMDPDSDTVAVIDENATHDIPGPEVTTPDVVVEAGVEPKTDMENVEIPQERVATRAEDVRTSIDPESGVDTPHAPSDSAVPVYEDDLPANSFRKSWVEVLNDSGVVPPKGRIIFPDEPITYEGFDVDGDVVVLTQDIYRMALPFRSTRPTFMLLARKGRAIPKNRLLSKSAYEKAVRTLHTPEDE